MEGGRGINNFMPDQVRLKIGDQVFRIGVMEYWSGGRCGKIRIGDIKN
jgi:hypothetical protein